MGPWLFNAILKFFIFLENLLKKTRSMDEIRAKRLAYFQNLQLNQLENLATTSKAIEKIQPEVTQIEKDLVDSIVDTRITTFVDTKLSPGIVLERKEIKTTNDKNHDQEFSQIDFQSELINANDDLDIIIIDPEEVKKDLERRRLNVHKEEYNQSLLKKKEELELRLDTKLTQLISKRIEIIQQKPKTSKSQVNKFKINSAIAIRITKVLEHKLIKISEKKKERRYKVMFQGSKQAW